MQENIVANAPLVTNDAVVLGLLALILGWYFILLAVKILPAKSFINMYQRC